MAKPEDTARQDTRTFLAYLRDALSQPPLDAGMATATISMVRLLAEQDTGKRLASRDHLDAALAQQNASGKRVVFQVVIYDLPNRDCSALASNGELGVDDLSVPPGDVGRVKAALRQLPG